MCVKHSCNPDPACVCCGTKVRPGQITDSTSAASSVPSYYQTFTSAACDELALFSLLLVPLVFLFGIGFLIFLRCDLSLTSPCCLIQRCEAASCRPRDRCEGLCTRSSGCDCPVSIGTFWPINCSIARNSRRSPEQQNDRATPSAPARPVRPIRWI